MIENYRDEFDIFFDEENDNLLEIDEDSELDLDDDNLPLNEDDNLEYNNSLELINDISEDKCTPYTKEITSKTISSSLIRAIHFEMMKPEYNRNKFNFKYRGEEYSGIPLQKINEGKYIFLIDKKMKGIHLNEMILL